MSSKIHPPGADLQCTPLEWRRVSAPDPAGAAATPIYKPLPQTAPQPQATRATEAPQQPAGPSAAEIEAMVAQRVKQARDEALRQGEAAGRQKALAELDQMMQQMARSIEAMAGMKSRLRQEAERDVVAVALAVARKLLRRQITVDEEAILGLVKAAMENASLREVTEIRLHPRYLSQLQNYLNQIGAPEAIRATPDTTLELGAVILETDRGSIDASLDTQLEEISRGLTDAVTIAGRRA